jgi:hypothetical protein
MTRLSYIELSHSGRTRSPVLRAGQGLPSGDEYGARLRGRQGRERFRVLKTVNFC